MDRVERVAGLADLEQERDRFAAHRRTVERDVGRLEQEIDRAIGVAEVPHAARELELALGGDLARQVLVLAERRPQPERVEVQRASPRRVLPATRA